MIDEEPGARAPLVSPHGRCARNVRDVRFRGSIRDLRTPKSPGLICRAEALFTRPLARHAERPDLRSRRTVGRAEPPPSGLVAGVDESTNTRATLRRLQPPRYGLVHAVELLV